MLIRPAAARWALGRASPDVASRRALGLPTDRPIIMTGHQPEIWHPGILAKYLAAEAAARALGAEPAWMVVDQERPESVLIRYPARRENGSWRAVTATLAASIEPERGTPAEVGEGLSQIAQAWSRHDAPTVAARVAETLADLLSPLVPSAPTILATDLHRTPIMASLVARMARDPEACVGAYNAAVAAHPAAGVRPLEANAVQDRYELPLWHLPPGAPRRHVHAEDLASIPLHELAPKALLMTAIARLSLCDLFIHGTGGGGGAAEGDDGHVGASEHGGYDLVTDRWLGAWLGADVALAPVTVVTATLLMPLSAEPAPSLAEAARARWLAHHARHEPSAIGDDAAAARKRALVDRVRASRGPDRRAAFREMHAMLDDWRRTRAADLSALDARAESLRLRLADSEVLMDRTWPFPLYPPTMLRDLQLQIRSAFGRDR